MTRFSLLLVLLTMFGITAVAQDYSFPALDIRKHEHHTGAPSSAASNSRSDSLDISNYSIWLDVTDFQGQTISGRCAVSFSAKVDGITQLPLDLLSLTVDSVKQGGSHLNFSHDDTLLLVDLPATMNTSDNATVDVWYQGEPTQDVSGWGGWYFSGNYAWNLGVAFEANPHNYGRVWYPCFDNFVERATYDYYVTTAGGRVAVCNGQMQAETNLGGDTIQRHWQLGSEIPTYLACVAVSNYVPVDMVHNGLAGPVNIQLWAIPGDTTALKNSFVHLPDAISAFESGYGPHQWSRVGYQLVPFNGGAMEHATSITYPRSFGVGGVAGETLMAHELAHSWWGNYVTCRTAEDMWINEGMASFSEFLFTETVYGWDEYIHDVRDALITMIRFAHLREEGYRAVSGVPHEYTYGDHVYTKGSLMAHSMRGYMGDAEFFGGLSSFLASHAWQDVSSEDFRDHLTASTAVNMDDFFDNWIFNGGWTHYGVDSFTVSGSGPYSVEVFVKQKLKGAPDFYRNVPLEFSFADASFNTDLHSAIVDGETSSYTFSVPFVPSMVYLNKNTRVCTALTEEELVVDGPGLLNTDHAMIDLTITSVTDSVLLRVEHNWVHPDPIKDIANFKYRLSENRWWRILSNHDNWSATAQIIYDGNTSSTSSGWLDHDLVDVTEDSLFLLHRADPHADWQVYPHYTKNVLGNPNNSFGVLELSQVLPGEYALANQDQTVFVAEPQAQPGNPIKLFPNPTDGQLTLDLSGLDQRTGQLVIYDTAGNLTHSQTITQSTNQLQLDARNWTAGAYLYSLRTSEQAYSGRFVVK